MQGWDQALGQGLSLQAIPMPRAQRTEKLYRRKTGKKNHFPNNWYPSRLKTTLPSHTEVWYYLIGSVTTLLYSFIIYHLNFLIL